MLVVKDELLQKNRKMADQFNGFLVFGGHVHAGRKNWRETDLQRTKTDAVHRNRKCLRGPERGQVRRATGG